MTGLKVSKFALHHNCYTIIVVYSISTTPSSDNSVIVGPE